MGIVAQSASGIDPRSLDALKLNTKSGSDSASNRKVAQQFESMFLSLTLKSMRSTLPGSDPMANEASKMATDMYDQQLAQSMATKGRGVGLADAIFAQMERAQGRSPAAPSDLKASTLTDAMRAEALKSPTLTLNRLRMPTSESKASAAMPVAAPAASAPAAGGPVHQTFVDRFKEAAMSAAEATGLPVKVLMGQAALESGWGKREVRDSQGTGSFNLFGIKAGANWTGPTVDAVTTEVVNGVAQKVVQKFRAYSSYAESFADYAKLIVNNPRYEKAVQAADDALKFAKEMGKSGYATDPAYGNKLAQVLTGPLSKLL